MIHHGLKGVAAAETSISHIDGEAGRLLYRGYEIEEAASHHSFEEAAYLLWHGEWPNKEELEKLKGELVKGRMLSPYVKKIISLLPENMDMMSVIRTAVSAEGVSSYKWKPAVSEAVRLTGMIPSIISARKRILEKQPVREPDPELSHTENYLYMLNGEKPAKAHAEALETYMILAMEHGMNASAFSARVTVSTESDLISGVTAAAGTMKGPLHGGAPSEVLLLLEEIAEAGDAEKVMREKLERGERLMGFGHRVYKTIDPRSRVLKNKLMELAGKDEWLDLSIRTEKTAVRLLEEFKPGRALYTNVEYYAAAIMKAIQMAPELFTPTFTAARTVGWTAHIIEQAHHNTLFRPQSVYIGPAR